MVHHAWPGGFTLVELMVVVAIVAMLIALTLPALARARDLARLTQCASNLHQIVTAMNAYAAQWQGRFPPNTAGNAAAKPSIPQMYWYDDERIGAYLPGLHPMVPSGKVGGGAYMCPNDSWSAIAFLSYAMNVWASPVIDATIATQIPRSGRLWGANVKHASQVLLLSEAFSGVGTATGANAGFFPPPTVGAAYASSGAPLYAQLVTSAGERFGGNGGILFTAVRFGKVASELAFYRHRTRGMPGTATAPLGRINIAYADGHVASKTNADLVLPSGQATGDTIWSLADLNGN